MKLYVPLLLPTHCFQAWVYRTMRRLTHVDRDSHGLWSNHCLVHPIFHSYALCVASCRSCWRGGPIIIGTQTYTFCVRPKSSIFRSR